MPIDPSTAFVSYARKDLDFVTRLAKDLKAKGAKVWMDKLDIRPGQRWEAEIEAAVDGCSRMLVILSPAAIASSNVLAEAALALEEGKEVIPVLYRECRIPFRLRPFQYSDFRVDYAAGMEELLATFSGERPATATAIVQIIPPDGMNAEVAQLYRSALGGDSGAMYAVGFAYYSGTGAPKDYVEAVTWFRKAADAGNALGMYSMGSMYANEQGVGQDYAEAVAWYRKAADAGSPMGMQALGFMYRKGMGVQQDYNEAVSWFRKAAQRGYAPAMDNLGTHYLNGWGVKKDPEQALAWYRKAAQGGDKDATDYLRALGGNL